MSVYQEQQIANALDKMVETYKDSVKRYDELNGRFVAAIESIARSLEAFIHKP